MMLYSRFPNSYELYYTFTLIGFVLLVFMCNMYTWMKFDKMMRWDELNEDKEMIVSKIFLNAWDWSTDTKAEMDELRRVKKREIKLTIDE